MNVALIGSRRNRSGIGQYIARYFHQNGASVTAVLGTTEQSASTSAAALQEYGIDATAYTDFTTMAEDSTFDTVVIASPSSTHYEYIIQSLKAGAHIFCEKPFVFSAKNDIEKMLKSIFTLADAENLTIAMNSQWPFSLPFYEELCGSIDPEKVDCFFIRLSPICTGKEMILESVPHALSILYCICGSGTLSNLAVHHPHEEHLTIHGDYRSQNTRLTVEIELIRNEFPPREFSFGLNDMHVKRTLNVDTYDIFFNHANSIRKIVDPLDLSVQDFMAAVRDKREPLIGKSHIISTTLLLKQLYTSCTVI
jgi:predicted dehydrogenase